MTKPDLLKKWANENVDTLGKDVIDIVDSQTKLWSEKKPEQENGLTPIKGIIQEAINQTKEKSSSAENILAEALLKAGLSFQRQYPISPYEKPDGGTGARYYLDFLINETLNVEISGEVWHDKEQDKIRDTYLKKMGYEVVRFPVSQVYFDVESITEHIKKIFDRIGG